MLCTFVFFCLTVSSGIAATGDLQVTCEPGVRIFIDGILKGETYQEDNGLFVEGLSPGEHTLRANKTNYQPITRKFIIIENQAIEIILTFEEPKEEWLGRERQERDRECSHCQ